MDLTFKSTFRDTKYQIHIHPSQSGNTLSGEKSNFKKLFLVLLIINEFVPLPLSRALVRIKLGCFEICSEIFKQKS